LLHVAGQSSLNKALKQYYNKAISRGIIQVLISFLPMIVDLSVGIALFNRQFAFFLKQIRNALDLLRVLPAPLCFRCDLGVKIPGRDKKLAVDGNRRDSLIS
jgi:hypothetical protein